MEARMGMPPAGTRRPQTPAATAPAIVKEEFGATVMRFCFICVMERSNSIAYAGYVAQAESVVEAGLNAQELRSYWGLTARKKDMHLVASAPDRLAETTTHRLLARTYAPRAFTPRLIGNDVMQPGGPQHSAKS
jgi:hypothetical protein